MIRADERWEIIHGKLMVFREWEFLNTDEKAQRVWCWCHPKREELKVFLEIAVKVEDEGQKR